MIYELKVVPESEQQLLFMPKKEEPSFELKVGCVRGDFGKAGDEFHHTWFPHKEELNTDEFKAELTRVVNSLRSEMVHPLLKSRDEMARYCRNHPQNELKGHWIEGTFSFKIERPKFTFYFKCLPLYGDYNFYVISYIVADENEVKRRSLEDELVILERMLHALRLDDIYVWFDDNGVLQAEDDEDNKWTGKAFYEFLTNECLCFRSDGMLTDGQYVEEELLELYKRYSTASGVVPGEDSRDENGGGSDGDN